jgi:hypothetical protein
MKTGTRHLRIHYRVSNDLGLWWSSGLRKWINPDEDTMAATIGLSSSRGFHTKRRAFGHARHMGKGFVVTQFNPHCGQRRRLGYGTWLMKEWEVT